MIDDIAFPTTAAKDLWSLVFGKKIGSGMSRVVYEYLPDPSYVIKEEKYVGHFQNVIEWEIWENVQYIPHIAKWFAPCLKISPNGMYLIQKKVTPAEANKYPKEIPYFFKDLKMDNYGLLNGKIVCCDYGTFLREDHFDTKRMKKVKWK